MTWPGVTCQNTCLPSLSQGYGLKRVVANLPACNQTARKKLVVLAQATGFGKAVVPNLAGGVANLPLPDLGGASVQSRWNPVHLAMLGDGVWELLVRSHFFSPPTRLEKYYDNVKSRVRAEAQALDYEMLLSGHVLKDREREILRWGLNSKATPPKRLTRSGQEIAVYKKATAVECLVGYLYLTDSKRLQEVTAVLLSLPYAQSS